MTRAVQQLKIRLGKNFEIILEGEKQMEMDSKDQEVKKKPVSLMGAGIAIGAGVGVALGVVLKNLAIGIAVGTGVGLVFGAGLDQRRKNKD